MGLFDLFGKKDVNAGLSKQVPYMLKTEFVPYRLKSKERSSSVLSIGLKNMTGEPVMGSVVVEVPKQLSFDSMGTSKQREVKFGTIGKDEERATSIEIYGGVGTDKGTYTVTITAFVHYRDYGHVLNEMRKRTVLEAV